MPIGAKDYIFGIHGMFIIAPTRFGAHNWETVGELSSKSSVKSIQFALQKYDFLPQIDLEFSIMMGHSMGGHGSWISAMNQPNNIVCLLPIAGWIKKEEYSNSNAFFQLDQDSSYIEPGLYIIH